MLKSFHKFFMSAGAARAAFFVAAIVVAMAAVAVPSAQAATPLKYGVWLPFWKSQDGAQNISQNLDQLQEVSPFSYEVGGGGVLIDDLHITNGSWDPWFSAVHDLNIKVIPTIAWFDGPGIYAMLSNTRARQAEEDRIAGLVASEGFDGIDIDFESMLPKTRPYYSLFIQGLALRLHPAKKMLTCTIQSRTPLGELYATIPTNVTYTENYTVLNQNCDEVRIMTYDQQTIDLTLNAAKGNGNLYSPVADPAWVRSVIKETLKYINPRKIMLGVPTYGYEYQVSWTAGETTYERVRAFDYLDAMDRADSMGIEPVRNNAGELSFTFASSTHLHVPPILVSTIPSAQPIELANSAPSSTLFFVSFPDAQSILDKINLAKQYGLRGVMLFKADGNIDPLVWEYMK